MRIARIAYINTDPFFYEWAGGDAFELISGTPRELARLAWEGRVDAGPLPLVECWALESKFTTLDNWGIAAREGVRSVLLVSKKPWHSMDGARIGLTEESSTSVKLLKVLSRFKYNVAPVFQTGFSDDDQARLLIGDDALEVWNTPDPAWGYTTDLAAEWWNWQKKPFVFARWIVRKDADPALVKRLQTLIDESLSNGLHNLPVIAADAAKMSSLLPPRSLKDFKL
jgi:chorismate dehydratase